MHPLENERAWDSQRKVYSLREGEGRGAGGRLARGSRFETVATSYRWPRVCLSIDLREGQL